MSAADVQRARAAGVHDDALAEAIHVALFFNTINRIVDALGFEHRSDHDRRRGAEILRRRGYRLPGFLLRQRPDGSGIESRARRADTGAEQL